MGENKRTDTQTVKPIRRDGGGTCAEPVKRVPKQFKLNASLPLFFRHLLESIQTDTQ